MDRGGTILALDMARVCGWAEGTVSDLSAGRKPLSGAVRFGDTSSPRKEVLREATRWLNNRFKVSLPSLVIVEVPDFYGKNSSMDVMRMLERLAGIAEMVSAQWGVMLHWEYPAREIRKVFIERGNLKGEEAKRITFAKCKKLGWEPASIDAAEALAAFAFACEKLFPGSTTATMPLFQGERVFRVASA